MCSVKSLQLLIGEKHQRKGKLLWHKQKNNAEVGEQVFWSLSDLTKERKKSAEEDAMKVDVSLCLLLPLFFLLKENQPEKIIENKFYIVCFT